MEDEFEDVSFKELLGYSIEGEEAAHDVYTKISEEVSGLPSDRFESLASDEMKHKETLLKMHEKEFGDRDYVVPDGKDLPPHEGELIDIEPDKVKVLTTAIASAIKAEQNAYRVYMHLARENEEHRDIFKYIAMMEKGHKESLEEERKSIWENYVDEKGGDTSITELDMWGF